MEKYLESISIFYDEKVKFLSMKDNFISCNNCPNVKSFKESSSEEVSFNCGGGSKDCGVKIKIKFPKYFNYEKDIQKLKMELNNGINLEVINNYIDVSKEFKDKQLKDKMIQEKINKITEEFYKMNVESKKEDIHKFYKSRIEKTKRSRDILTKLNNSSIDSSIKTGLRKEYISLIIQLNKEYQDINNLINSFNPYMKFQEPEVMIDIKEKKDLEKKKKKKKTKKDKDKKNKKFQYTKGERVHWMEGDKIIEGYITNDTPQKSKLIKTTTTDDKKFFIPKGKLISGIHEPEPEPEGKEVIKEEKKDIQKEIKYSKEKHWLSTFNTARPFKFDGIEYPSVENAFQAQKINDNDPRVKEYKYIFSTYNYKTLSSREANKMGRKLFSPGIEGFYTIRNDFDKIKRKIMKDIKREYYLSNKEELHKLNNTNNSKLINNEEDIFWGIKGSEGNNHHGKILMEIREELN